jgi:hypothetical protein
MILEQSSLEQRRRSARPPNMPHVDLSIIPSGLAPVTSANPTRRPDCNHAVSLGKYVRSLFLTRHGPALQSDVFAERPERTAEGIFVRPRERSADGDFFSQNAIQGAGIIRNTVEKPR